MTFISYQSFTIDMILYLFSPACFLFISVEKIELFHRSFFVVELGIGELCLLFSCFSFSFDIILYLFSPAAPACLFAFISAPWLKIHLHIHIMEPILEEERDTTSVKTNLLYFSEVPTLTKEGGQTIRLDQIIYIKLAQG